MSAPTEYQTNGPIGTGGMHTGHGQPKKSSKARKILTLAGAAALLLIGAGIGSAGKPEPVTIEKEVPGPERTVTKTVEVPVTPESCLTALTLNEQAFGYSSESLNAILDGDYAAAGAATKKMTALVPQVNAAKSSCRAAAN